MMEFKCDFCGSLFYRYKSQVTGKVKTCSPECRSSILKTRNGNFFSRRGNLVSLTGNSHGSLVTEDRSMDVGIDAAYNVFGEHRFFTLEEVYDILSKKPIISGDYHDSEVN